MNDLAYRISELERKLNNLLRFGTIDQLDTEKALVRVKTGNITTGWLPWATRRAGPDREWWMPEQQEQVLILSPAGDLAQGLVLPATYQDQFPPNGNDQHIHRISYQNGDYWEHNRETGQMTINVKKLRIFGPVEQTGGDMTSDGVSAQHHNHDKTTPGKGKTGEPVK